VSPLIALLKKETFSWSHEENKSFHEKLKEDMCTTPILVTPDFTQTFIMECDSSGHGIGVILM
jgi:hypothetical protein